ncbi:MAG TPA: SH3 domain-containing protein [bacterium]|nr:SH3 domain-containing protein [bacterium]
MRRLLIIPAAAIFLASAEASATPYEQLGVGNVFASTSATLRSDPAPDAKVVSHAPKGGRLVYRKQLIEGDKPVWYLVQPPGLATPAWVSAAEVSTTSLSGVPVGKPLKLLDSGLGAARPTSSMTAAAHGLDDRAKQYGEKQGMKLSVDQFLTLEKSVETLYQDPHKADASYDETQDNPVRKDHANNFLRGVR